MMPLKIWTNADLSPEALTLLRSGTAAHALVIANEQTGNLSAGGPSAELPGCDIAFGQPDADQVIGLPELKWVHITSAGYTRYDRDDFRAAGKIFTNSSSVFDEPCAQHVLAFLLAHCRQLSDSQRLAPNWSFDQLRPKTSVLRDQTVLIVGYGAIARLLVELLAPFPLNLIGVRRQVRGDEAIPTHPIENLAALLPTADYVINILPASPSTNQLFAQPQFDSMKPGTVFINIGRGNTVDQPALVQSLVTGHLAAAYLDVTDPEPLPSDHALWHTPNCFITPHIAGGFQNESVGIVEHFLQNLRLYEANDSLLDLVWQPLTTNH
jgi:phosphoglycerate dehydrogenase-like enzyme